MKTTPVLLSAILLICLVILPLPARAGLLDWIASFGEKKQELVDKSRSHYREALEQSGIREEEMRERERTRKDPVISDEEHFSNVNRVRAEYEDALESLLVTEAKLQDKLNRTSDPAERRRIQKEMDKIIRQVPSIEQEIRNHGGNPMDSHLSAGSEIDKLRRDSRNRTPITEDSAEVFLPGFGGGLFGGGRQTSRNTARSVSTPIKPTAPKPGGMRGGRGPGGRVHNPAEGAHH